MTAHASYRPDPGPWVEFAECHGVDPDLFFPVQGSNATDAKGVCNVCPVKAECLEYGMKEKTGVWGGLTERERARERRRRAAARARARESA